jgi:hypothetical protein
MEVDKARITLALRFLFGDDDGGAIQVYMLRLDVPGFLWPSRRDREEEDCGGWVGLLRRWPAPFGSSENLLYGTGAGRWPNQSTRPQLE